MAGSDDKILHVSSAKEFNDALKNNSFVVVDFTAEWCPPCKAIHPLYAKLAAATALPNHLAFVSIDVDDVPEIGDEYQISSMPSFLFFANGELASVDTNGLVKRGPGVVLEDGRVRMIKGIDPAALRDVVMALSRAARAKAKEAETSKETPGETAKEESKEPKVVEDEKNGDGEGKEGVSGSYSLGTDGGKRSDWKMKLNP